MIHWRNCLASAVPKLAVIAHDLIQVWVCWVALHAARYSMLVHPPGLPYADWRTLVVLIAQAVVFWRVGLYRGLWRFASVPDLWNIFKSAFSGLIVIVLVLSVTRFEGGTAICVGCLSLCVVSVAWDASVAVSGLERLPIDSPGRFL